MACLLITPAITAGGVADCSQYVNAWDATGVYLIAGNTDIARLGELSEAVSCANSYTSSATPTIVLNGDITIDDNLISSPAAGTDGGNAFPIVAVPLAIQGNNHTIRRDANAAVRYRFFQVNQGGNLTLSDITLAGGNPLADTIPRGGAIYVEGDLTLLNSQISDSSAVEGGGIYTIMGNVTITGSTITNNDATVGGGIYNQSIELRVTDSAISNNTGGGMHNAGIAVTLFTRISDNTAADGAGVYNRGGLLVVANSVIANNLSPLDNSKGGGLYSTDDGLVGLVNTIVENNQAAVGGGIYHDSQQPMEILYSTIIDNINNNALTGSNITNVGPVSIANSIVAGGSGGASISQNTTMSLDFGGINIVEDPTIMDSTVLNVDPQLGPDRVPLSGSPAVDAADASLTPPDTEDIDSDGDTTEQIPFDVNGDERSRGAGPDIGAQEAKARPIVDGRITPSDVVFVLNRLGDNPSDSIDDTDDARADINNDGFINATDVQLIIDALGTTTD